MWPKLAACQDRVMNSGLSDQQPKAIGKVHYKEASKQASQAVKQFFQTVDNGSRVKTQGCCSEGLDSGGLVPFSSPQHW